MDALKAIGNCDNKEETRAEFIAELFPEIVRIGRGTNPAHCRQVALVLHRFSRFPESALQMEAVDGLFELAVSLVGMRSISVRTPAARALALLCIFGNNSRARTIALGEAPVRAIVALLKSDSDEFRLDGVRALCDICEDGSLDLVVAAGGIDAAAHMFFKSRMPFPCSRAAELLFRLQHFAGPEQIAAALIAHRMPDMPPAACANMPPVASLMELIAEQ
jgi:hypothetical protein